MEARQDTEGNRNTLNTLANQILNHFLLLATLRIFFQSSCTWFISGNSLAALTQLFIVPAEISPQSALARSDDKKAIIFFFESYRIAFCKFNKTIRRCSIHLFQKTNQPSFVWVSSCLTLDCSMK